MSGYSRVRRQQLLQEAEGYLDLIMAVPDAEPLQAGHRIRLARRALAALEQVDRNECDHVRWHYLRGQSLRLMERYHQAIDSLRRAAECDAENVHISLALAWCFKRIGRLDLAISALEDALDMGATRGIVHYNLACYWSLAKNVSLTLYHLSRAFELQPDYRQLVTTEPDFDPVRNHPEFLTLTNVAV